MDEPPFAALLRRHRRGAGLTQEALAERAGISWRTVSDLERGLSHLPRRDTLALLAEALGLAGAERARLEAARYRGTPPPESQGVPPGQVMCLPGRMMYPHFTKCS